MYSIIGQIGKQSLIDIKHPCVLPITINLHRPRKRCGMVRDSLQIQHVPVPGHVLLHEPQAPRGNLSPRTRIVRLDCVLPTIAIQNLLPPITPDPLIGGMVVVVIRLRDLDD